jgi:hypothetical protein
MDPRAQAPAVPDRATAFARVQAELGRSKLVDPGKLASLRLQAGERVRWGAFQLTTIWVTRSLSRVSEPWLDEPAEPPRAAEPWAPEWPPRALDDLKEKAFDLRSDWKELACPECQATGHQECSLCRGLGKVADKPTGGRQVDCPRCQGRGHTDCKRCQARGRLLEFARVEQRIARQREELRLPFDAEAVPRGPASGEADFGLSLGFEHRADVEAAARSDDLARSAWFPALVKALCEREPGAPPARGERRLGWREARGRWYDGWLLTCEAAGKPARYFVPDTGARIVGPRLRHPFKVAAAVAIAAAVALLLLALGGWLWPAREEPGQTPRPVDMGRSASAGPGDGRALELERARRLAEDPTELDAALRLYLELAREGPLPPGDEAAREAAGRRLGEQLQALGIRLSFGVEGAPARRPWVLGETNLPDGALLQVSVIDPAGRALASLRMAVALFRFQSEPLGPPEGLPPGEYRLSVRLLAPGEQPAHVRSILGARGERLAGPHVRREAGGELSVEAQRALRLGDGP